MPKRIAKTDEGKAAARAQRDKRKAERQREERKKEQELIARRKEQLGVAATAIDRLRNELREVRRRQNAREALHDHATGFYQEIDKLAKGKTLLEVTNLIVDEANDVIRDAKALIRGDQFLDRVKEFVPAGNNPVYPDVVVNLKTVLQALGRAESQFEAAEETIDELYDHALTIHGALHVFVEENTYASKNDVLRFMQADAVVDNWFVTTGAGTHFDFDRLDDTDLADYLSSDEPAL